MKLFLTIYINVYVNAYTYLKYVLICYPIRKYL
jgi:hypothetical protein